ALLPFIRRRPSTSTLFPYTTLFRSEVALELHIFGQAFRARCHMGDQLTIGAIDLAEQISGFCKVGADVCLVAFMLGLQLIELLRSEEHTSELQSRENLVCRLLLEKK